VWGRGEGWHQGLKVARPHNEGPPSPPAPPPRRAAASALPTVAPETSRTGTTAVRLWGRGDGTGDR